MGSCLFNHIRCLPWTGGKAKRKGIREEKEREAGERGEARERAQERELSVFSGRIPEA